MSPNHRVADCRRPTRCWRCLGEGHRSYACSQFKRSYYSSSRYQVRCWRCLKVGHKAISCWDRTRVHHESSSPHRRVDCSKEGSPPFLYSDLGGFVAASSHEGSQGCSTRKTKHITFATPLTQVCEEQIMPVLDNSDLLIEGNMFSVEVPKQSIFSCDPM